jgi:tRNA-uridine 2-sulfurtransferase
VRRLAAEIGLPNAKKKDSTGICFIGERPFREFLNRYLPMQPGPILDADGRRVGEHVGLAFYTLGQRKGIGVGGTKEGSGEPWFVARKDMASNTLWVVQGHDHPWLMSEALAALDAAWVAGEPPRTGTRLTAKTRYRQTDAECTVFVVNGGVNDGVNGVANGVVDGAIDSMGRGGRFELRFDAPQWAVTPGQSAVLYDGEVCLGGGVIEAATMAPATMTGQAESIGVAGHDL